MSNGSSPGNFQLAAISLDQATVLSAISAILGGLASLDPDPESSAALEIVSVVAKLGALFSPDPIQSEISEFADEIYSALYTELGAIAAANQVQTRKTFLDQLVVAASTALSDLPNALQDPLHYSPGSLILPCQTVLNDFAVKDNLIWNVTYLVDEYGEIYWNDGGQYKAPAITAQRTVVPTRTMSTLSMGSKRRRSMMTE